MTAPPPTAVRWHVLDDGGRMPYVTFGDAAGPPLVAMPGLTDGLAPLSESRAARALVRPPAELAGCRTVVVSHRHPLPAEVTTEQLAEDAAAFLAAVVHRPALVSGHSMGAMVALHLAAGRPDLVERLVLSAPLAAADDRLRERLRHWEDLLRAGRWRAFYADAIDASYTGGARLRRRLFLRVTGAPALPHLLDRHLALSRACREHDATGTLAAIRQLALVIAGERDLVTGADRARELAAALPDAELVVLPGVGHGFPEQAREAYRHALVRFAAAPAGRVES